MTSPLEGSKEGGTLLEMNFNNQTSMDRKSTHTPTSLAASDEAPRQSPLAAPQGTPDTDGDAPTGAPNSIVPKGTNIIDLSTLRDAIPSTSTVQEAVWRVISKPKKDLNLPKNKKGEKRRPPSRQARLHARAEARRVRNLEGKESKLTSGVEAASKAHVAPLSVTRSPSANTGAGVSPAEQASGPSISVSDSATQRVKRPRGKRAGRLAKSKDTAKPTKRVRQNDTLSPREVKRVKPSTPRKPGSANYADALRANDLCVAILTEPFKMMTEAQAASVEGAVEEALDEFIYGKQGTSSELPPRAPAFRGRAIFGEGVLKLWCEDNFAKEWLTTVINRIKSPCSGTRLVVKRQSEIPKRVKGTVFVPRYKGEDLDQLRKRFQSQNPWYNINQWVVYHAQRQEAKESILLVLGIPEGDVPKLHARERRLAYRLGSVHVSLKETAEEEPKGDPSCASTAAVAAPKPVPMDTQTVDLGVAKDAAPGEPRSNPNPSVGKETKEVKPPVAAAATERERRPAPIDWWDLQDPEVDVELSSASDGLPSSSPLHD